MPRRDWSNLVIATAEPRRLRAALPPLSEEEPEEEGGGRERVSAGRVGSGGGLTTASRGRDHSRVGGGGML